MNTGKLIIRLCGEYGITVSELAAKIGQSRQNFAKKLQRDTVTEKELRDITAALGVSYEQRFFMNDVTVLKDFIGAAQVDYFMPLFCHSEHFGNGAEFIERIPEPERRAIAEAEYRYFRGEYGRAAALAEPYLRSMPVSLRMTSNIIYCVSNLTQGNIEIGRERYTMIRETCEKLRLSGGTKSELAAVNLALLCMRAIIQIPEDSGVDYVEYFRMMPRGVKLLSFFVMAKRQYLLKNYEAAYYSAFIALEMYSETFTLPYIYLNLMCAVALMHMDRVGEARRHFQKAWSLAKKEHYYMPFAEMHGLLLGLVEISLKDTEPEAYKEIEFLTYSYSRNWFYIHNLINQTKVTRSLSTVEFSVAKLASSGWSNRRIADYMGLSESRIKQTLSAIYQILGISGRKELERHLL